MDAYAQADEALLGATDDASLVEARGGRVVVVEGSPENFKVTDRVDLRHAEQILAERRW
jgi:2-C-methyl-D-erythritol 4-phosphate cytidylyltransferase